jgi:hypothetical protein
MSRRAFLHHPAPRPRRVPRPCDLGFGMSVCIAAITGKSIVWCTDGMVSLMGGAVTSDDAGFKARTLKPMRWHVMFAGDDVVAIPAIVERVQADLAAKDEHTASEVAASFVASFQAERTARAVETILGIYQIDMGEFLSNGTTVFGEAGFGILRERIEQVRLGISFLVAGFDGKANPHLFVIEEPNPANGRYGFVSYLDWPGYWAIGSGDHNALGRLAVRKQNTMREIPETVYNVIEAKVGAESAFGVGQHMFLAVHRFDDPILYINYEEQAIARNHALAALAPAVPVNVIEAISSGLKSIEQFREANQAASATNSSNDQT